MYEKVLRSAKIRLFSPSRKDLMFIYMILPEIPEKKVYYLDFTSWIIFTFYSWLWNVFVIDYHVTISVFVEEKNIILFFARGNQLFVIFTLVANTVVPSGKTMFDPRNIDKNTDSEHLSRIKKKYFAGVDVFICVSMNVHCAIIYVDCRILYLLLSDVRGKLCITSLVRENHIGRVFTQKLIQKKILNMH